MSVSCHGIVATFAAGLGKHILVEKPIAGNIEDAKSIVDSAEKNNVILAVGHVERHNGLVSLISEHLKNNSWGELLTLSASRFSNYPDRITDVGVLYDLTIHDVDIILSLVNSPVKCVFAAGNNHMNDAHEDQICLNLYFQTSLFQHYL